MTSAFVLFPLSGAFIQGCRQDGLAHLPRAVKTRGWPTTQSLFTPGDGEVCYLAVTRVQLRRGTPAEQPFMVNSASSLITEEPLGPAHETFRFK